MYVALLMAINTKRASLCSLNYAAVTTNAIDLFMKTSESKFRISIMIEA